MSPIWIVILPFAGSLCAAFLPSHARNTAVWLAGAIAIACVTLTFQLYPQVASEGVVRAVVPWVPELGLNFTFRVDGFAWLFAMLVSVMGALVILYARYYMAVQDPVPRFFAFFLAFMDAMLGVVLSGNLIGCIHKKRPVSVSLLTAARDTALTPVSVYLHSATMVKADVFLLVLAAGCFI